LIPQAAVPVMVQSAWGLGRWERSWLLATAAPGRWTGRKDLVVVDGLIGRWGVAG
jgi:hypothetical protein